MRMRYWAAAAVFAANLAAIGQAAAIADPPAVALQSLKSGPYRDDSMELARITMPRDAYIATMNAAFVNGFRIGMGGQDASLEKETPGITKEIEAALASVVKPFIQKSYENTLASFARLYSRHMDAAETADLASFYRSAIGQKIIAAKYGHLASAEVAEGFVGKESTTASDVRQMNRDVAKNVVPTLSDDEKRMLLNLMGKPVFAKMRALAPVVAQLEAEQANEEDPALEAAIEQAMGDVLARHDKAD